MAPHLVLLIALCCAPWADAGATLLPSYQLLLPFPGPPAAPLAASAPANRVLVLLPGASPGPLSAAALDSAHQQVEASAARASPQLPPQPSRADFQAQAQARADFQAQAQARADYQSQQALARADFQAQQAQARAQAFQEDAAAARAGPAFQASPRGRPEFQTQVARQQQQQQQIEYQSSMESRGEFGPQPMRSAAGLGRALQPQNSYQALVADYRFRQQQLQQQAATYQPLSTQYQFRQQPQQRPSPEYQYRQQPYQSASPEYQFRQQAYQGSSPPAEYQQGTDFRPGPYPLPAARADFGQQQQVQQQQAVELEAARPEFRALLPAARQSPGLLPGQEYSVNFEGDGFGYGYTIRGDHNLQRPF